MDIFNFPKEMNQIQRDGFIDWYNGRPQVIKDMVRQLPPWERYYLIDHGPISEYRIMSYREDGTLTAQRFDIRGKKLAPRHNVFGIKPDDLAVHNADSRKVGRRMN